MQAGNALAQPAPADPVPELDAATLWQQANVAMEAGDYELAIELCQLLLVREPANPDPLLAMARVHSWQARYPESIEQYDRYLGARPNDLDARVERARVLGWKGDYVAGEAAIREVLVLEPENVDANLLLASLLEWQGRQQEAADVYAWVARIDPAAAVPGAGPGDEPEGGEPGPDAPGTDPSEEPVPGNRGKLSALASYAGDSNGFARVAGRVGPTFGLPGTNVSLGAFAAAQMLKDGNTSAVGGYGGGLTATWLVDPRVELAAEASALYYPHAGGVLDYGGLLGASWFFSAAWSLGVTLDTLLWGGPGQSAATQLAQVRAWRGSVWSWVEHKRFNMWGQLSIAGLTGPGHPATAVTTLGLQPMVRVVGTDPRFLVGYKLWGINYSSPAPAESPYWSPALYVSHQLALRLEGDLPRKGVWYLDAGGGLGHEWKRPLVGSGGASQPGEWVLFPVVSGGAGVRAPLTERLDLRLGGWSTFSSRTWQGRLSRYALWEAETELTYRW